VSDRIVVPFIWVPHGQKPDPADLARFSQPVRVPAWFVRRKPAVAEEPPPEDQAHGWDESWGTEAGAIPAGTDPAEPVWEPSGYDLPQADPIAAFLRVEAALGRMGFTNVIRRADAGRSEDGFTTLAQMMVPDPGTEEHLNKRPASTIAAAPYIADDPRQWIGRPSVGTGECVPLVQQATGAPRSTLWRPGALVQGNTAIRPGTAIATFDSGGHYTGHAAIYLGQDEHGIQVIDQWNIRKNGFIVKKHQPSLRTLSLGDPRHARIDRGEFYHVVE